MKGSDDDQSGKVEYTQPSSIADEVQQALSDYRQSLYGGRGPGISEEERLANTSLRPTVAGIPTATSREDLHLRTAGARGEGAQVAGEPLAAAQFRGLSEQTAADPSTRSLAPERSPTVDPPARQRRDLFSLAGWLAATRMWVREPRQRTGRARRKDCR